MASPFVAPVTASQVGNCFVNQYYHILQSQPHLVHQFYTDASSMFRVDGEKKEVALAVLQIHSLVMSLNFNNYDIKMLHSMESWNGGVLVTVNGSVQMKDFSEKRKFVETFFLAPQAKGFFVLNDIFHLLDNEWTSQHSSSILSHNKFESEMNASNSIPEPALDYVLQREMQSRDIVVAPHVEENNSFGTYCISEPDQQSFQADGRLEEASKEELSSPFQTAVDEMDLPVVPVQECGAGLPKQTYAAVLRISRGNQATSIATQNPVIDSDRHIFSLEEQSSAVPAKELHGVEVAEENAVPEGEEKSVYVRNLPITVSASDIEETFKGFGRIRIDGIFIRSRKDVGVCYAFVEFEDIVGVQNAIQASPIQLGGRQVYIEERRGSNSLSRGRRGRGRGRTQSDSFKGRFSGQSSGRGNGDGSERDYVNRTGGNNFYQRGS